MHIQMNIHRLHDQMTGC